MAGYYRKFIANFGTIARPLHELTSANRKFVWSNEAQFAFDRLKKLLTSPPVLSGLVAGCDFLLDVDASGEGIGAVLSQCREDRGEHVLEYYSRKLSASERN